MTHSAYIVRYTNNGKGSIEREVIRRIEDFTPSLLWQSLAEYAKENGYTELRFDRTVYGAHYNTPDLVDSVCLEPYADHGSQ